MLPSDIRQEISKELTITDYSPLGGSSLNNVGKLKSGKESFFIKWNTIDRKKVFEAEVFGLRKLNAESNELIIPDLVLYGHNRNHTWLIFEFIQETKSSGNSAENFGRNLAALHQVTGEQFGLEIDNYIGNIPQKNTPVNDWVTFFSEYRLKNLLQIAIKRGLIPAGFEKNADRLVNKLHEIFPEEPPSLIHGDLWSGNYMTLGEHTVLIDPAVYYANREIEIAFTRLFGGFPNNFYKAYQEAWPLKEGFESRIDIYNLYPLLVHTLLFGTSYATQVTQILKRF